MNMNILKNLLESIDSIKDTLSNAEDNLESFLSPILKELGISRGYPHNVYIQNNIVGMSICGSTRGCSWEDYYEFPLSIFESMYPIKAAQEYMENKKKEEENKERQGKIYQLQKLQEELGISS